MRKVAKEFLGFFRVCDDNLLGQSGKRNVFRHGLFAMDIKSAATIFIVVNILEEPIAENYEPSNRCTKLKIITHSTRKVLSNFLQTLLIFEL